MRWISEMNFISRNLHFVKPVRANCPRYPLRLAVHKMARTLVTTLPPFRGQTMKQMMILVLGTIAVGNALGTSIPAMWSGDTPKSSRKMAGINMQLRLWELENGSATFPPAHLFHRFPSTCGVMSQHPSLSHWHRWARWFPAVGAQRNPFGMSGRSLVPKANKLLLWWTHQP